MGRCHLTDMCDIQQANRSNQSLSDILMQQCTVCVFEFASIVAQVEAEMEMGERHALQFSIDAFVFRFVNKPVIFSVPLLTSMAN